MIVKDVITSEKYQLVGLDLKAKGKTKMIYFKTFQ